MHDHVHFQNEVGPLRNIVLKMYISKMLLKMFPVGMEIQNITILEQAFDTKTIPTKTTYIHFLIFFI